MASRSSRQVGKKARVGRPVTKRTSSTEPRTTVKVSPDVVRQAYRMAIDLHREALKELERY